MMTIPLKYCSRVKSEFAENSAVLSNVSKTRAESTPVKFGPERRQSLGDSGIVSLGKLILIAPCDFA